MKRLLYSIFDAITLPLCGIGMVRAAIGRLAYQRKRVVRRIVEARLLAAGLYGDEVQRGPFAGLKYLPPTRYASCRFEKIIGSYEFELHELITRLATTKTYKTIVNIGAAEGFYTAGLARLFPGAKMISFESTKEGRACAMELCALNQVETRVEFHGTCTLAEFAALAPQEPVLVMMDIDLGERVMLVPEQVSWLKRADVLVELHECLQPGTNDLVRSHVEGTHTIETLTSAGLPYANYPCLRDLRFDEIYAMVGEDRLGLQDWFYLEPKP